MNKKVIWPGWETVDLIGRGSFGSVYEIQRDVFGETEKAALKVISIPQNASDIAEMYSEGYDEESITETFREHLKNIVSEYTTMRKFSDCVTIVSCDDVRYVRHEDGIGWDIFIKMELLTPLTKALPTQISEETVVKLATDICAALVVCEKHGLIHRDIKPQNIFVSASGIYKLGDFGIAKTVEKTMGGTKSGTYKYMAPEVYNNQPYGTAADIYSLGLVLYWLLNERRMPFMPLPPEKIKAGMEEDSRLRRFSGEPLPPPAYGSEKLKKIVLKACAFDPKKRYSSAAQLLTELSDLSESRPDTGSVVLDRNNADTDDDLTVGLFSRAEHENQSTENETADVGSVLHVIPIDYQKPKKTGAPSIGADEYEKTLRLFAEKARVSLKTVYEKKTDMLQKAPNLPEQRDDGVQRTAQRQERKIQGKQNPPKKLSLVISCILVAVLILVIGFFTIHIWTPATCTEPSVCRICGRIGTVPIDHNFSYATCTISSACKICGEKGESALGHDFSVATCTDPAICQRCNATEPALGHDWIVATCTDSGVCQRCRETKPALGHNWIDSADWKLGVCSRCKIRKKPDPVYITDLDFYKKEGKLWTMGEELPGYFQYRNYTEIDWNVTEPTAYYDVNMDKPGHSLGPVYDYLGNKYTCGLHVDGSKKAAYSVTYYIEGLYTEFSGYCCLTPDLTKEMVGSFSKYFEIRDEKGNVLNDKVELKYGSSRAYFCVDVTGVQYLTIWYPKTNGYSRIAAIFDGKLS